MIEFTNEIFDLTQDDDAVPDRGAVFVFDEQTDACPLF